MCGRAKLTTPADALERAFGWPVDPGWDRPRWNVAPTQDLLARRAGGARLEPMRFGLHDGARLHINARAETLFDKPAFREAARLRRCAVVVDGFYEWRREGGARAQPYLFQRPDGAPFWVAGIWQFEGSAAGCALVTTPPADVVAPVHDRMPALLAGDALERWMDPRERAPEVLRPLLLPDGHLVARPVSTRVNSAANDDPACADPPSPPPQLSLF